MRLPNLKLKKILIKKFVRTMKKKVFEDLHKN